MLRSGAKAMVPYTQCFEGRLHHKAAGGPGGVRLREREDMQEFRPVGGVGASGVLGMEEG